MLPVVKVSVAAAEPSYNRLSLQGGILAYDDLRDWIKALDQAGELKRIRTEADPILEIAEIADRVSKSHVPVEGRTPSSVHRSAAPQLGGSALLFGNLKGYPSAQLLINQFGSARRMQLALEVDSLDEIAERIRGFMDVKSPQGFLDKARQFLVARFPHPAMLAERCRTLHHAPLRNHPRSKNRQAQRRHVSHADL